MSFSRRRGSPSALWKLLKEPRDVCTDILSDRFDTTTFYHPDGSHHGTTNVRQSSLLEEDVRVFDAAFFNISPNEADSIDWHGLSMTIDTACLSSLIAVHECVKSIRIEESRTVVAAGTQVILNLEM